MERKLSAFDAVKALRGTMMVGEITKVVNAARAERAGKIGRKNATDKAVIAGLRSLGFCCGLCASYEKGRCNLNTDFHGVCAMPVDDICVWFMEKKSA